MEEEAEALTCLVIIVHFDHSWFQVPHWQLLLQHHTVGHCLVLLQLRHSKLFSSSLLQLLLNRQSEDFYKSKNPHYLLIVCLDQIVPFSEEIIYFILQPAKHII